MNSLENILQQLLQLSDFASKHELLCILSLSSSREKIDECYLGGIRLAETFLLISVVNLSQRNIESLASFINDNIDAILVDVEKKHPFETIFPPMIQLPTWPIF